MKSLIKKISSISIAGGMLAGMTTLAAPANAQVQEKTSSTLDNMPVSGNDLLGAGCRNMQFSDAWDLSKDKVRWHIIDPPHHNWLLVLRSKEDTDAARNIMAAAIRQGKPETMTSGICRANYYINSQQVVQVEYKIIGNKARIGTAYVNWYAR